MIELQTALISDSPSSIAHTSPLLRFCPIELHVDIRGFVGNVVHPANVEIFTCGGVCTSASWMVEESNPHVVTWALARNDLVENKD